MLTPERGEHPQLGEGGRPPEQRGDALVFSVGEVVLANQVGRDRGVAPERCGGGGSLGHASDAFAPETPRSRARNTRSEEHTSELQSPCNLVCRLLLEKKKKKSCIDYAW